ncbi:hypothetical protein [Actinosynnema mirum]|uniref:DUF3558 domain-containing protein n=1 Tax=Actinosynnema mirum (strain ATCC 29888 / DSM 43827 / JCM 3225 / NBRC 14064 / NCIMB 13271 / NRRL B-12336 / IMRU 3971 / 101) TaxID=446462 RepID=C6WHI9_ACTMD|nr:hypothetical protein [Actinosynnema mirum]ACU39938.1 hypothetical protein Amir_6131 [Actinosynnema mirum DSM 43827]
MAYVVKFSRTLPALLCLAALSACTSSEPGTASPAGSPTQAVPTGSAAPSGQDLSALDACELLKGISSTVPTQTPKELGQHECEAVVNRDHTIAINIRPELGLADYNLGSQAEPSDTTVGSHEGKLVKKSLTNLDCTVVIGVGAKARVDVVGISDASLDEACSLATEVATAIEPKLP